MRISLKHWLRQKKNPWLKIFYQSFKLFKKDRRQEKLLDFEGLNSKSVVLDFGGFEGNWAFDMNERYGCSVHVFEPHPIFVQRLRERFKDNGNIIIHDYALGQEDGVLNLSDDGDASSALQVKGSSVEGKVLAANTFFENNNEVLFSVAKINIEGGEYDLLPALINSDLISRISVLQIQFHLYNENNIRDREKLVERINMTHRSNWSYPFVWEQWTRN